MATAEGIGERLKAVLSRIRRLPSAARLLCAVLIVLAAAGVVWLAAGRGNAGLPPKGNPALPAGTPRRAAVQPHDQTPRPEAAGTGKDEGLALPGGNDAGGEHLPPLGQIVSDQDLWRTQAQNDKRWQAAKMEWLSSLVMRFPAVKSASVIFDPGSGKKLGSPAVKPTAAVYVCLAEDQAMTSSLTVAIADLVSGSIAGMSRSDVRVVDSSGCSYRAPEFNSAEPSLPDNTIAQLSRAEDDALRKIRTLLRHIDGALFTVKGTGGQDGCRVKAWISIPRSHLLAAHLASGGQPPRSEDDFERIAQPHLARIRQSAMHALGVEDEGAVTVDSYRDAPPPAGVQAGLPGQGRHGLIRGLPGAGEAAALTGIGAAWLAATGALAARKLKARRQAIRTQGRQPLSAGPDNQPPDDRPAGLAQAGGREAPRNDLPVVEPFAFLDAVSVEDISTALSGENAQTVAVVLSNLAPARAAAVLCMLDKPRQVEVARRLAKVGSLDRRVLAELARGLAAKLKGAPARAEEQESKADRLADILHHAEYHTEQTVLQALLEDQPVLAESIRNRLLAFEDISKLPAEDLRPAMKLVDSDDLAVALRTAGRDVRKRIFSALSLSDGRKLKQEMERIGPVRLSDVEAAQQQVVNAIRQARHGLYIGRAARRSDAPVPDA